MVRCSQLGNEGGWRPTVGFPSSTETDFAHRNKHRIATALHLGVQQRKTFDCEGQIEDGISAFQLNEFQCNLIWVTLLSQL